MKLIEILKFSEEYLSKYSFSKPRLESEKMISDVLNIDRLGLYTNFEIELSESEKEKIKKYLKEMVKERKKFSELDREEKMDFKEINRELLQKSIDYLKEKEVPDYKLDAEYIFAHILNVSRSFLMFQLSKEISEEQKDRIRKMIVQRGKYRKPLQQILGEWEFYGYPFKINENVLIPRQDTEILVEQCKHLMLDLKNAKILDIGTGSGAIAVTLAKELPESEVTAADISPEALEVAKSNAEFNRAENVKFIKSNIFSEISADEKFDLIVSNPPYIPLDEYEKLMREVKEHEPKLALTDNGNGYYFYETISREAKAHLKSGGYLAFEVGYNQAGRVAELAEENGLSLVGIIKDYSGIERVVISRKVGE